MNNLKFRKCFEREFVAVTKKYGHILIDRAVVFDNGAVYDNTNEFRIKRLLIDWDATFKLPHNIQRGISSIAWFTFDEKCATKYNKETKSWLLFWDEDFLELGSFFDGMEEK